jgi:hypothetical protein
MRRLDLRESRRHAEVRFARALSELRDVQQQADTAAHRGDWREAANKMHACLVMTSEAAGTCYELTLLYQITEE